MTPPYKSQWLRNAIIDAHFGGHPEILGVSSTEDETQIHHTLGATERGVSSLVAQALKRRNPLTGKTGIPAPREQESF